MSAVRSVVGVARSLSLAVAVVAGVTACTGSGGGPADSTAPSTVRSPTATLAGATTVRPTGPFASSAPPVTPAPSDTEPGAGVPPLVELAVEGGDPVAGQLGTYVWDGGGSDSPWLPGAGIRAATGEVLRVGFAPDLEVSGWSALLATAVADDGTGAIPVGAGQGPLEVIAPGSGTWTLAVTIAFGARGTATWFWRLEVP